MKTLIALAVLVIAGAILIPQVLFTVDETQHRVVTRFGKVTGVFSTPGLKVKAPFVDNVSTFEKRLLRVDVPPASMPDAENQFLDIDAFVRYRIVDARRFLETLANEEAAAFRLGAIVTAEMRAEVGRSVRSDIIGGEISVDETGVPIVKARLDSNGVPSREALVRRVMARSNERVNRPENNFGVTIDDIRIKRTDFPAATEENVFARMRTEREIQAQRLRAEGQSDFLFITASVDRDLQIIEAEADEKSNVLRGQGEAEAINILAEALSNDAEFYTFLRSLEAYKKILAEGSTVVLPADSPLFRYLQDPSMPTTEPTK